jgi:hypothetical protein
MPNFSSLHPLNPPPTTITPLPKRRTADKIKALFQRKPKHQKMASHAQALESLTERDESSVGAEQDDFSMSSTAVASSLSLLDLVDSDIGAAADFSGTRHLHEHSARQTLTSHAYPADQLGVDMKRDSPDPEKSASVNLERAKLDALANDDEVYDEHVVREYRDLSLEDHASSATHPAYSGT